MKNLGFNNTYDKDNHYQKRWDALKMNCFCTLRETCDDCTEEVMAYREQQRQKLILECKKVQYQLFNVSVIFGITRVNYNQ